MYVCMYVTSFVVVLITRILGVYLCESAGFGDSCTGRSSTSTGSRWSLPWFSCATEIFSEELKIMAGCPGMEMGLTEVK
jgi:hypothetical protein